MNRSGSVVLVTGASGLVGRALCAALAQQGARVLALRHRQPVPALPGVEPVANLDAIPDDTRIDAIVNLAGALILGGPWTAGRRRQLRESRLATTGALVNLVGRLKTAPATLVSASAVGYYGVRGDEPLDEAAAPQDIFQSRLCQDWEAEANRAAAFGVRVVVLRLGVVLAPTGGALAPLALAARAGLGAVLGDGRQGFPWIHLDDVVRLVGFALDTPALAGPVNAVAPGHVSQRGFTDTLARVLRRPRWLRMPAWPLRLLLGEMAQLLVDGQHVVPAQCQRHGFRFAHPALDGALRDVLAPRRP